MRCPYCHNPQIVKGKGRGQINQVMEFLKKRQGLLDGVVLSGGEASVYPDISHFIKDIRALGYAIKLDTNGLRPDIMADLFANNALDYIALDYKAPPGKFKRVTGTEKYDLFSQTLDMLCAQRSVKFEVRTTVHTDLMNEDDINAIIDDLDQRQYTGTYAVQNFTHSDDRPTLGLIKPQRRTLDIQVLRQSKRFQIQFRNF